MVTQPLCKVCQSRHWLTEPHIWKGEPERVEAQIKRDVPTGPLASNGRISAQPVIWPTEDPPASPSKPKRLEQAKADVKAIEAGQPKRDRAAYMREYRAAHPKVKA